MNKKYVFLVLGIFIFCLASALTVNTFTNLQTSENLTFTGNQNITRNISIPYNALVNSALVNLSGNLNYADCYQETANVSTVCGGLNTGIYSCVGTFQNSCLNGYDGNWYGTSVSPAEYSEDFLYINYTKPANAISAYIKHKWNNQLPDYVTYNDKIPNTCFSYNKISLSVSVARNLDYYPSYLKCYNGTSWITIRTISMDGWTAQMGFYEEAITWNLSYYPTSPYIQINNTKIWNFTGTFNTTNNKTSDFSTTANNMLSSGTCNGGVINGINCEIPFIFHSDTTGVLQYSDLNITYTPAPFVTLITPLNNTWSPAIKTFNCSATDEIGLKNITFNFWNSTGNLNLSKTINLTGTSNYTTYQMTFNSTDAFIWGCSAFNNNSRSWYSNNFTINVNIANPVITLTAPVNDKWINTNNVSFNYIPEQSTETIDSCQLWGNFTGTWKLNQTDFSINQSNTNTFYQTLPNGTYIWNVWCNTTSTGNSAFANQNYTFTIDTIKPIINTISITTTPSSTQFNFTANITDTNLNICEYAIYSGSTSSANTTFSCNQNTIANAPGFGTYTLVIYANDTAGNDVSSNSTFSTTVATTTTTTGGGGGGSSVVVAVSKLDWTLKTAGNTGKYVITMSSDTSRKQKLIFMNNGNTNHKISISCDNNQTISNFCKYVTFSTNSINLPVLKDTETAVYFTINLPANFTTGNYYFNVIGEDENNGINILTVKVDVGTGNLLIKLGSKFFTSINIFGLELSYIVVAFFLWIFFSVFYYFVLFEKLKGGKSFSILVAFVTALLIVAVS